MPRIIKTTFAAAILIGLAGCATYPPMPGVKNVDLDRFMGDWYVIASIPTWFEKDIYNAVERYERLEPRKIQTTFSYRKGGFDGEQRQMEPVGFVKEDGSNALWDMQFVWPFKADYRIVYLDPDYRNTIIGRIKRDYVWIMSRKPHLSEAEFRKLARRVEELGYDITKLSRVPQRWEDQS